MMMVVMMIVMTKTMMMCHDIGNLRQNVFFLLHKKVQATHYSFNKLGGT